MLIDLTKECVRADNGGVDVESTMEKMRLLVAKFAASQRLDHDAIKSAIDQVFDAHPNVTFNQDVVVTKATQILTGDDVSNYSFIKTRVLDFIHANNQGKKLPDGSEERPNSLYIASKGKGASFKKREKVVSENNE